MLYFSVAKWLGKLGLKHMINCFLFKITIELSQADIEEAVGSLIKRIGQNV